MPALLVEIGCEELPANACRAAEEQLPALIEKHLGAAPDRVWIGPRRLAFLLAALAERAPDELRRGPGEGIAFDADGNPTKACEGFARGQGLAVPDLERRDGYVWARVPGQALADTLPDRVADVVRGLAFGKPMQWVAGGMRFSRPIRWLCVKLDGETVAVELEDVPSGGVTYGHRFTHDAAVEIASPDAYEETLRRAGVEPDAGERRRLIVEGLDQLGPWQDPAGKLAEVVHLVELPHVLEGTFADRFLALPERVVTTAMQSHQRYFPLGGPRFGFVANGGDPDVVRAGNERVLEGRLEDASFTFERDVAMGIEGLAARLPSITFVAKAGSFAAKAERLVRLVAALGGDAEAAEAARLAKADQAAELVREFPDLEGHIGAQYARLAGQPDAVCRAIEEQYLPDAAGGPLPATAAGRVLAAAEKLDNLVVSFSIGQRPTGSRDPYGLRRAAIGLCRLATEGGLALDLRALVPLAHGLLVEQGADVSADPPVDVVDFVEERFEQLLDVPVEVVRAARAAQLDDLGAVAGLAEALAAALDTQAFADAYAVHDRAARITAKVDDPTALAHRPDLSTEAAEAALWARLDEVEPQVESGLARGDVAAALAAAADLADPVETFFTDVHVMADDDDLRASRLAILARVKRVVGRLGDLSQIPR